MRGWIAVLCILCAAEQASAQYFQFSQYNFSSQRVSPSAPALSPYASLGFLYRNQGTASDVKLNSNMLSAAYPLISRINGKPWSGIGVTLMDDRSGGIFSVQEASASYAVNVSLNSFQSLALGFRALYQQRRIDLGGLFTGAQYVADRGFDPSIYSGETIGTLRADFITFSSGIAWQHVDNNGVRLASWSVSLFDFNKPDESFQGNESELPSTWVASGSIRAFRESNMSVFPEVLYTRSAANNVLNVGLVTRCDVKGQPGSTPFHVDVITKYVVRRSGIVGLQFHNENISVGFSYDFLIHRNNVANVGALEVGLELRRLVNPARQLASKQKRPATQTKNPAPTNRPVAKQPLAKQPPVQNKDTARAATPQQPNLSATLQMKRDSVVARAKAGQVTHEPFEIEKVTLHFNFEFNSSELDEESTTYLDQLAGAMSEDPHLRIKLTGHTDNVGTAHFNMRLSQYRAHAVKEYLVSKGVSASRIETEGRGLTQPLNDNRTEKDRAANRRVELTIYYAE